MQHETKKLGEMLVEAKLITPAQLSEALRQQRFSGGRMGSNLVAMGYISEDVLMDFLSHQTGVPRLDLKNLDVSLVTLAKIPRRMAEQLNILPVALKEPRSLVLAMADPSDLNAVDSARFASGLNVEPVVVSYSALKQAIQEQYRKLETAAPSRIVEVGGGLTLDENEGLPLPFELPVQGVSEPTPKVAQIHRHGHDPFFDPPPSPLPTQPLDPFDDFGAPVPFESPSPSPEAPLIIPARSARAQSVRPLDAYETRTLILGLIKLLQRRGVIGDSELQRFLVNLIESGEIKEGRP